jgi:hypothetical protein
MTGGLPAQGGGALVALMHAPEDHGQQTERNADDEQEFVDGHEEKLRTNPNNGHHESQGIHRRINH